MSNNRFNRRNISGITGNISFLPQITDFTSEQFLAEILKIHENQYTPINHFPTILGRPINLLALYNAVAKRGGFKKMNTEWSWEGVLSDLKMPTKCANASVALRSIFQRYLEPFERLQRSKATINDIEEELQMESDSRYKTTTQRTTLSHCNFNPISMVYRADIHQITGQKRQESGLSCDLSDFVEFKKLELSLKSGLVNEIEFSLNTILLMSFQSEGVQLCRNHRILDLILKSVGIGDKAMLWEIKEHDQATRRFLQFWNDIVIFKRGRKFLLPDIFVLDHYDVPKTDPLNQIFKEYDELTFYDKEGQRIQLVATIIRNLALDTLNSRFITQSHQCMRMILLCCHTSHSALRQIGLEILSMLSFPVVGILYETLRYFLIDLVSSEDRVDRLRGLELLTNLSDQKVCIENIEFFNGLPKHLFGSLISMLIIHDLHIVVLALESIYSLSEVDPSLCVRIVECSSETLETIFVLLSLEAQVMGTHSLIRIRVMQGPGMISSISNNTKINRIDVAHPQSNHKQLATSLMPPPPVPTHKIPTTTVMIPHGTPLKSQIYPTTEAQATLNKPQLPQKINFALTKSNTNIIPSQSNVVVSNSDTHIVKAEIRTPTSVVPIVPEITTHNPIALKPTNPQIEPNKILTTINYNGQVLSYKPSVNLTAVTMPSISVTNSTNPNVQPKLTCISTVSSNQRSRENNTIVSKPTLQPNSTQMTLANCQTVLVSSNILEHNNQLSVNHSSTIPIFSNKQDFVKSWLLSNYIESPQCTVPLFVMYKQLQVAVQNYFKDSEMVTAEEFHKLVRILFPQVQLVQLHTSGAVEIHYYNLKVSPKSSKLEALLESHSSKNIQIANSVDHVHSVNNVSHINNAQSNYVGNPSKPNDLNTEQKLSKRHIPDMNNGHSAEGDLCQRKKLRTDKECEDTSLNYDNHNQTPHGSLHSKEADNNKYLNNGIVSQYPKNIISQFDEGMNQSRPNVIPNQLMNGSMVEELKHSDSETKAFSSSTVSPMHCESLANGTDGSSEETLDNEVVKVISNITTTKTEPIVSSTQVLHDSPPILPPEAAINETTSAEADFTGTGSSKRSVKKNNLNQLGRTRSRFRNNNPGSKGKQRGSSSQRPHNLSYLYICEWDNCLQSFDKPQKVYGHVYTNHFMTLRTEVESMCFWAGCKDITQRTPLPLLNHVNEQHCNNVALEAARQIRLAKEKENEKSSPNSLENVVIKTEMESTPKLLNICPPQSNIRTISVTNSIKSYQSDKPSYSATDTITTLSTCTPIQSPLLNIPSTATSPPSLATIEQMIVCSNAIPQLSTLIPSKTTSTPIVQQEPTSSPLNVPSEIVTLEASINRDPVQALPTIKAAINIPSTNTPVTSTNPNTTASRPISPINKPSLKEGPVTKHIRFLSALILRNLCQCSPEARRFVAARHQQIFEMSISGCESSRALSECLFYSSIEVTGNSHRHKTPL